MQNADFGKIKSLVLRDFLTYDDLTYFPEKHLNILIGPNGSGKSTIVAGIVLGCGGKPALLSRSKSIADFVKNGKEQAKIEISIFGKSSNRATTFHRSFNKKSKESYKIDGKTVSGKEYCRVIATYNIQVDNLCMFLPQDRVQDFTQLNAQQLLTNTQASVCSSQINEVFEKLLTLREKQKNSSKSSADLQQQLDDNNAKNVVLKKQIDLNKKKDDLIDEMNLCRAKKVWLEFEELQVKFKDVEKDLRHSKKALNEREAQLKPLEDEQKKQAGDKTALRQEHSKAGSSITQNINELVKMQEASNEIESSFNRAKQNLTHVIQSVKDHKSQVEEQKCLVQAFQHEHNLAIREAEENGDLQQEIRQCDMEISKVKTMIEKFMNKRNVIQQSLEENVVPSMRNCQRKIQNLTDTLRQRVDVLKQQSEHAYLAYEWLKKNRHQFRGKIFDPPLIEITVKEKKFAKYIENTVANRDLVCFICTDKDDNKRLFDIFRKEKQWNVNLAMVEDCDEIRYLPQKEIGDYNPNLGLYAYLIDVIDGPPQVINHLCKLFGLHKVAIGDDRTFQKAQDIPNEFRVFFSTNHRFACTISKYSGHKSTLSNEIHTSNMMNVGVDEQMKIHEENNLAKWQAEADKKRGEMEVIQHDITKFESTINQIKLVKSGHMKVLNNVQHTKEKLRRKEIELENLINKKVDVDMEKRKFKEKVDGFAQNKFKICENQISKLVEFKDNSLKKVLALKKLQLFDAVTGNVDERIDVIKREIEMNKTLFNRVKATYDTTKEQIDSKKSEAMKLTQGLNPTNPNYKYKEKFAELSNEIEDLRDQIRDFQGRIDCLVGVDPAVVREYEDRLKEIKIIENQMANDMLNLNNIELTIKDLHEQWYPQISKVVQDINRHFMDFFSKMGFAGEVELIRKEERDYADYGIEIRVQYRDRDKLRILNRHAQSGGERSVAIAIYTLSLQHLTHVPFRCVDEINQGMDPTNERKIFQMLVDITCREDQSQYFFVTPKLLPDLPTSEFMTISVVHNGEFIEDPRRFISSGSMAGRATQVEEQDLNFSSDDDDE